VRESQRQGIDGWARDNVVRMGRWEFDPSLVQVPVTIWFGGQDSWAPVSWLLATFPTASAHVLAGQGHLLLFDHPGAVISDLLASAD
jgi:pimeloyl-ACP methyl ester carboxylesterase